MTLVPSGSNAPAITSPLLAWPSLPTTRSPLSTPPSSASLRAASNPSMYSRPDVVDRKGKGKAVEESRDFEEGNEGSERRYGPPKQPLTPHQLSRIAQSFGIIVPSLPPPSPGSSSPLAGPSRLRHDPPARTSPYLLTVIPPLSLLSLQSTTDDEADKRTRKWRRGRLIPLQPTLAGMLVAIAREFGLPNTTGLQVYMGSSNSLSSASSAASISSADPGPHISSATWPTLFGAHISSSSQSPTAIHTPNKGSGSLARDITYPLSPLSLVEKKLEQESTTRIHRLRTVASAQPVRAIRSPTPPISAPGPNPIIGTIEFDIDTEAATWYPEYRRSGRYRKSSTSSESGIRQLRLPQHLSAASPAFIRQTSQSRSRVLRESDGFDQFPVSASEDTTLNDHEDMAFGNREGLKGFPSIRSNEGRRLSVKRQGNGEGAMSTAGSFGEMADADTSFDSVYSEQDDGRVDIPAIMLHARGPSGEHGQMEEDLLASPIALDTAALASVDRVRDGDIKRGSAVVMSEQLDDLERLMRQLSPRDIRLTSPRMLTPRMAAKVATSHLQHPVDPTPRRAPSSLAREPVIPTFALAIPAASTSTYSVNTIATQSSVPSFDATTLSRPPLEAEYSDAGLPIPTWPAVPFAKLAESPGSPSSIHDFFRATSRSSAHDGPISPETATRMRIPSPPEVPTSIPRRPNRPPSPELLENSIPHHSLPSEYVDQIHQRSPSSTAVPVSPGPTRSKSRSGSISLKGLKSRNFGWKRSDHEKQPPPALPLVPRRPEGEDPVGLFGSDRLSPQSSTFPSVGRSASYSAQAASISEFGQIPTPPPEGTNQSLPTKGNKESGFSRWMNPFGSRKSSGPESPNLPDTSKDRGSKSSKRQPSIDGRTIGSPVSGTLKRHPQPGMQHQTSPSLSSVYSHTRPGLNGDMSSSGTSHTMVSEVDGDQSGQMSPRSMSSPRSVKRKPVPPPLGSMPVRGSEDTQRGMKGSLSMGSVASFAMDEKRAAVGLGVRVG